MKKIFVYGTLRKGMYNYDLYLKEEHSFCEYAYIKGSLYSIKGRQYPAYIEEGNQMILGEIHEVSDEVFENINALEGYDEQDLENNEYNRVIKDIYNEEHKVMCSLPVFVYNTDNKKNAPLDTCIESGDFVVYVKSNQK